MSSASAPKEQAPAEGRSRPKLLVIRQSLWSLAKWSTRPLLLALVILLLLVVLARSRFGSVAVAYAYLRGDRLIVEPQSIAFGQARIGEERVLHFRVSNWTGKTVQLVGSKATCGCISTETFPLNILHAESCELSLKLRIPPKAGSMIKAVTYYNDSEVKPVFMVTIHGKIVE